MAKQKAPDTLDQFESLKEKVLKGSFFPFYLLMGEEPYYVEKAISLISEHALEDYERDFNQYTLYASDTNCREIIDICSRFPMMAQRQLVIVKEAQSLKKSEELIKKLRSLTSRHQSYALSHTVSVAGRIKTMNESIYRNVDAIGSAIEENCKIRFRYFEWSAEGEKRLRRDGGFYTVSPFFLIWDNENYYLIGVEESSGEKRHFRVDKMQNIENTEETRDGKELFGDLTAADYENRTFGMFGGKEEHVTLWWSNSLSGVYYDRFGDARAVRKDGDGFISSHRLMVSPVFYSFLMGFGGKVKILSPQWVQQEFCDLARKSLAPYESEKSQ